MRDRKFDVIVCIDGFEMSVQASEGAYCDPRDDMGPYSRVEVGYPNREESLLMPWAESANRPTDTVYAYVPSEIVWDVIIKHGGYKEGELPPLVIGR